MTDSVRESAQAPQATQAPRRNVAAKTSLATDLSLIAELPWPPLAPHRATVRSAMAAS